MKYNAILGYSYYIMTMENGWVTLNIWMLLSICFFLKNWAQCGKKIIKHKSNYLYIPLARESLNWD